MFLMTKFNSKLFRKSKCLKRFLPGKFRYLATVAPPSSYLNSPGREPLLFKTIGTLLDEAAEKFPNRTAFIASHQNVELTFAQVKEKADKLASSLVALDVNKGDRVAIWAPNCEEWYITNLALAKCGAISVYLNPAYQGPEVLHCLNKVGARMVIAADTLKTQNYYKIMEEISPEIRNCPPGKLKSKNLPKLESLIFLANEEKPGSYKYTDVFEMGTNESTEKLKKIEKTIEPEDPSNIQFTSGTTGKPKAAILSHFAIVNNSHLISTVQEFHMKEHRLCLLAPFFHAMGSVIGILLCLHHGTTIVIPDYIFNPESALYVSNALYVAYLCVEKERCTIILGTPTMYVDIFHVMSKKNITLSTLEVAMAGGALCSPEMYKDMMSKLGIQRATWVYGLTESGPVAFMTGPAETPDRVTTTVGQLMPHTEAKVVDANGTIVPPNTPGELLLRGFLIMDGYWDDEEKTKEAITSKKWLRTGDQFVIDEAGYGKIVGRIKDLIIRGGENISPLEVEEFLITHPDAEDVQVFGIPDARLGEQVCACLKLKPGSNLTKSDIQQYCKGKIAHFKIPYYVYFMDEFPKTATGKIQRFKLREKIMKMLEKSG